MDRAAPQSQADVQSFNGLWVATSLYPFRAKRVTGVARPFVLRFFVSPW